MSRKRYWERAYSNVNFTQKKFKVQLRKEMDILIQEFSVDVTTTCITLRELIKEETIKKRRYTRQIQKFDEHDKEGVTDKDKDNDVYIVDDEDEDGDNEEEDGDEDNEDDVDNYDVDDDEEHENEDNDVRLVKKRKKYTIDITKFPRHKVLPALDDAPFITSKRKKSNGTGDIFRRCLITKTLHPTCDHCHLVMHFRNNCRCPHGKIKFLDCHLCRPYYEHHKMYTKEYNSSHKKYPPNPAYKANLRFN